ncbi:MAG: glycosyltransferase family 39 protein, partial [Desulfobacula sp.]|nr:glycosyltransferase family 39 protein [Desulfobacula sp.]
MAGTVLRFWNYDSLPYTYDELSALFRTNFDSFRELIVSGVKTTDMHPAGVQVFLFYWVKLVGQSEMAVKIPFVVAGIISIWFTFKLGKLWFSSTTGLLSASLMSVMQYAIMYSLVARPYAFGLMLCLTLAWFWSKVIFNSGKKHAWDVAGFIISAILCAYTHYFSALLALVISITGLFLVKRNNFIRYVLYGAIILLACFPHIHISLFQFGKKGLGGWLGPPEPDFFPYYFRFIFHHSNFFILITFIVFLTGFFTKKVNNKPINKFRLISLIWFVVPLLTGYLYSILADPVLQFSILIFSFPFGVLFIFSFTGDLKPV